jgi:hypothetical protein
MKLYLRTKDVIEQYKIIPLTNLNFNKPEHLFVLSIARCLSGVTETQVAVKTNWLRRWWENLKIKVAGSKLAKYEKTYDEFAITPDDILNEVSEYALGLCGIDFNFGDIYNAYYRKENR